MARNAGMPWCLCEQLCIFSNLLTQGRLLRFGASSPHSANQQQSITSTLQAMAISHRGTTGSGTAATSCWES